MNCLRETRWLRILALSVLFVAATPAIVRAQELRPLVWGSEQHFTVTWDAVQRQGRERVAGYVYNRSPYRFGNVRVLVDSVDASGRIVSQRVSWVLGELGADSRLSFEVSATPAASYRVSIFSYDRIDQAAMLMAP
jgi:hypothetical protein